MPNKIGNKFLSKIIIRNIDPLIKKDKMMERATTLMASSSFSGRTTARSYLPDITTDRTDAIAIYKAKTPNSSGLYNRVRMGDINIGIACATVVPVIRDITFLTKGLLRSDEREILLKIILI